MGIRPTVRGSVMNPNDHPHGGGEGKTGIGRPGPSHTLGQTGAGLEDKEEEQAVTTSGLVRRRDGRTFK